ncbi:GntR family transcriptional regulator [Pseudomonas oryzihabitans]|uniref:GntR family transcriptional regulator n=1 Tax=Pseudomonas oryzihabitans TaxID=47885 RepID=UPI0028954A59|nr:GntR family transcriptional regulator [Pseudomonas oryzihabitans]MDT3718354.1 GntR family transcriptional regulator [Pseudomonas oryzihabitans]
MPLSALSRSLPLSAEEEAYRHLLQAICAGRYRNGDRLIAEDIATTLGMSRMPVRSAFQRLAAEGLVTLRPHRGAVVSGLDLEAMREVFEMRSVLEGLAIRLATPHVGPREMTRLERLLEDMDEEQDPAAWLAQHRAFHEYLCSLAGRPRLLRQIIGLYALIEPHMLLWLHSDRPLSARDEHAPILAALYSGDAAEAERVLRTHIEDTVPDLLSFIERSGDQTRTQPLR